MALFDSPAAYDNFMGRYSTKLAEPFADFAGVARGDRVLDVGAGTGALTSELVRRGAVVAAADPTSAFATALRDREPSVEVHAAPAEELPWRDDSFDAVLAQLVVAFMNDAQVGVAEMRRVARSGATVAVSMWDREGMDMLAAVARAQTKLASGGPVPEAAVRYRTSAEIESLFATGFVDVDTVLLEVESRYDDFEEFWSVLRNGAGPAGAWAARLEGADLVAARDEVHRQLGEPDGPFTLRGRAWATKGTVS